MLQSTDGPCLDLTSAVADNQSSPEITAVCPCTVLLNAEFIRNSARPPVTASWGPSKPAECPACHSFIIYCVAPPWSPHRLKYHLIIQYISGVDAGGGRPDCRKTAVMYENAGTCRGDWSGKDAFSDGYSAALTWQNKRLPEALRLHLKHHSAGLGDSCCWIVLSNLVLLIYDSVSGLI